MDSFREAYGVLQQHAQTLRNQSDPNIDDLLTIVTESVSAYKVCKQRIDAVEQALKTALDSADMDLAPESEFEAAPETVVGGRSTRSTGGCAEFCVNGQSTAGASRPVRKHHEHQETRRTRRTAVWPAGQLQEA